MESRAGLISHTVEGVDGSRNLPHHQPANVGLDVPQMCYLFWSVHCTCMDDVMIYAQQERVQGAGCVCCFEEGFAEAFSSASTGC